MRPFFRIMRYVLVASLVFCFVAPASTLAQNSAPGSDGTHLPRPASSYRKQTEAGIPVRLDYFAPPSGPLIVFRFDEPDQPTKHWPSIDEQGRILDHLLGLLVDEHRDLPTTFPFSPASSRDALVAALDRKLVEPGANWDAKLGKPLHGAFGAVLTDELDKVLQSSPIANAFGAHGYALKLTGIGRIDMQHVKPLGGALLPTFIYVMDIDATKISPKG